ncbi:hypothetical protein [Nonomuraea sp. NEAU-A123]|nr:hypothetical protein [Nonomuraea sp. NEAU-A123]
MAWAFQAMIVDTEDPHALATDWWAGALGWQVEGRGPIRPA